MAMPDVARTAGITALADVRWIGVGGIERELVLPAVVDRHAVADRGNILRRDAYDDARDVTAGRDHRIFPAALLGTRGSGGVIVDAIVETVRLHAFEEERRDVGIPADRAGGVGDVVEFGRAGPRDALIAGELFVVGRAETLQIERNARDHLELHEMDVDRVVVIAEIDQIPDLRAADLRAFSRRLGETGVVEEHRIDHIAAAAAGPVAAARLEDRVERELTVDLHDLAVGDRFAQPKPARGAGGLHNAVPLRRHRAAAAAQRRAACGIVAGVGNARAGNVDTHDAPFQRRDELRKGAGIRRHGIVADGYLPPAEACEIHDDIVAFAGREEQFLHFYRFIEEAAVVADHVIRHDALARQTRAVSAARDAGGRARAELQVEESDRRAVEQAQPVAFGRNRKLRPALAVDGDDVAEELRHPIGVQLRILQRTVEAGGITVGED